MSKILVVFGATGNQGGSVVDFVLQDSTLSKEYSIRAVTRDPDSASAKSLRAKGVETFKGDASDPESLKNVMKDADTVFGVTFTVYDGKTYEHEWSHGKAMTDAAVAAGVKYFIFSTLPHIKSISGGKYTKVEGFDAKADVEAYIRKQPIKSAFFAPGSFMQNYNSHSVPRPMGNGEYGLFMPCSSETQLPMIDIAGDTGKWVGAMLADPKKFEGKRVDAATEMCSMDEIAQAISKSAGKTVKFVSVAPKDFLNFMPLTRSEPLCEMYLWHQDFGYFGPDTKENVKWASENARGKLTTFAEYLEKNPIKLE